MLNDLEVLISVRTRPGSSVALLIASEALRKAGYTVSTITQWGDNTGTEQIVVIPENRRSNG